MHDEPMTRKTIDQAIAVYAAIQNYEAGCAPTVRELKEICGISSNSVVEQYLLILREWGWIKWSRQKARTIRLTRPTERIVKRKAKQHGA